MKQIISILILISLSISAQAVTVLGWDRPILESSLEVAFTSGDFDAHVGWKGFSFTMTRQDSLSEKSISDIKFKLDSKIFKMDFTATEKYTDACGSTHYLALSKEFFVNPYTADQYVMNVTDHSTRLCDDKIANGIEVFSI